MVMLVSNRKK